MFDPYRKWLAIAPKDQPPNYYRLLGVDLFEEDLDVIEGAADKQMGFVRQYQSGEHASDAARILNELAAARICLLKPASKAAYDAKLRKELAKGEPDPDMAFADLTFSDKELNPRSIPRLRKQSEGQTRQMVMAGGLVAGVCVLLAMFLWSGRRTPEGEKSSPADKILASHPVQATVVTSTPSKRAGSPTEELTTKLSQSAKLGEWVDVLEWSEGVDWAPRGIHWNDSIVGKPGKDRITVRSGQWGCFPFAAIIDGDYEMEVEFVRLQGVDTVGIYFPVGKRTPMIRLAHEGYLSGVGLVDGAWFGVRQQGINNNQVYRILIRVNCEGDRARFSIDLDGINHIQWEGSYQALANADGHATMNQHAWIAGWKNRVVFQKVRVRMLTGAIRKDVFTEQDREQDLKNGLVRLVRELPESAKVGLGPLTVNQIPLEFASNNTERLWPLVTRDFRFCEDFYGAHAPSRLKCPIPQGARSFSVIGYNEASRTSQYVVYMDGMQVYQSRVTGIDIIRVDIPANGMVLELCADPAGDGAADHTYWCFPRFHADTADHVTDAMLDDKLSPLKFEVTSSEISGGPLTRNQPFGALRTAPVLFRDALPCDEFLFAHAPSTLIYRVPDGMTRFRAIGYNVVSQHVKYEVWADDNQIYESPQVGVVQIDVGLPSGTKTIQLKINELEGGQQNDFSMWCFPRLYRK